MSNSCLSCDLSEELHIPAFVKVKNYRGKRINIHSKVDNGTSSFIIMVNGERCTQMFHNRLFHFLIVISATGSEEKLEVALRYSWNEMNRIINKYWTVQNKQKQIENFYIHLFGSRRLPTSYIIYCTESKLKWWAIIMKNILLFNDVKLGLSIQQTMKMNLKYTHRYNRFGFSFLFDFCFIFFFRLHH